ncbi:MAG: ATP-binding protein [Candidatus Colwellbacteria bacterium]|nr:ATP-binding protein [Candidatus Colwellbacteria bacterium]
MATEAARAQSIVDIQDIKDGIVILKNGALRKVVLVDGLNFDLKSEDEQKIIIGTYQSLLNSLDFSIQINIHSRKLNVDEYLRSLEERQQNEPNKLLKIQLEEYREFVKSFVETNAIMAKSFFVVVPFDPPVLPGPAKSIFGKFLGGKKTASEGVGEINEAVDPLHQEQLDQRTEQVINSLRQIGLRAVALEDPELLELYFNYYNPATIEKRGEAIGRQGKSGIAGLEDIVAPASAEVSPNFIRIGEKYLKTLFVFNYPRYLSSGWFSPIINLPELLDISIFVHPLDTGTALKNLRRKTTQIEAQIMEGQEKGLIRNPLLETALQDIEMLRDSLQRAEEKLFDTSVYITIYADSEKELVGLENRIIKDLDSKLVNLKPANFEQLKGFVSTAPLARDELGIHTPLNSAPVSSFFPFIALDLTSDEGVLYGLNRHNNTVIIFDRFSLENANMVIFGKAGSGKSYATKLEVIRSMMLGSDLIIVDPENEYETLAKAVGGSYFRISLQSESTINPLDLPIMAEDETPGEALKSHIVDLSGLVKLMLGKISSEEEALLDQAITETYASKDITADKDFTGKEPPLLENLEEVLRNIEGGRDMANRLYRFTKGSYVGFANRPTNVNIDNRLIVFSVRDLEEELRPIAMYIILNFVWSLVRRELKKRIMVVDEAWWMMKYPDSASFLYRLAKRSRKYYLGISTITQDVEDFLNSPYGRPIITNSSLQLLLRQSPAAIELAAKSFNLTETEKSYLLEAEVGTGLFIAGLKHVAIQVVPSYFEDKLITTDPEQILREQDEL